jgi:hypothetical protein
MKNDPVFESIRTAQYRITCFYSNGQSPTAAYAKDWNEAFSKQKLVVTRLKWNGWDQPVPPHCRLYRDLDCVDVRIVDVNTGRAV